MQQRVTTSPETPTQASALTVNIVVRLVDGGHFSVSAPAGSRAIDAIRAFGLPLKAECEGRCLCTSCHVRVAGHWASRLAAPDAEELAKLRDVQGAGGASRLVCQLALTPDLEGLDIEIDPASLVPQTYWVAG